MRKMMHPLALIVLAVLFANCDEEMIDGGPCNYIEYPGSAVIVSVAEDTSQYRTCENAAVIVFTFQPDDPSASSNYLVPHWPDTNRDFLVGSGCTPPLNWAISQGLLVDSEHNCVRMESTSGTCTPVLFKFPDIDYSAWGDSCETR